MVKKQVMKYEDLEQLIDVYPGCMIMTDTEGHILAINNNLAKVFNAKREDLIGKSGFYYIEKGVAQERKGFIEKSIKTKQPMTFVDEERGKWWNTTLIPVLNDSEEVVKLSCYISDITKEKEQAEKNLLMKDEYYKALIENSSDLITLINAELKVVYHSPALLKLFGYELDNRLNHRAFDYLDDQEIIRLKKLEKELLPQYGATRKIKLHLRHRDGSYRYVESIVNNQLNNPHINGIIVNSRDITELEEQRMQIVNQKMYLESLINSVSEIIFTIDVTDHTVKLWSSAAELHTAIKYKEIQGKTIENVGLFENISEFQTYIENVANGRPGDLTRLIVYTPHKGKRLWGVSPSVIKWKDEPTEIVLICSDVTYRDQYYRGLIPGQSYLISDQSTEKTLDIFKSLLQEGWAGYYITRTQQDVEQIFQGKMPAFNIISIDKVVPTAISTLDDLYGNITTFVKTHERPVIFLDRIDYLILFFSFKEVMKTLYKITDVIKVHEGIFLLNINKLALTEEQLIFIQMEFRNISLREIPYEALTTDEYAILNYLMEASIKNIQVTQSSICEHEQMLKLVAQKRIRSLSTKGLITSRKQGPVKALYLTDKGRGVLQSWKTL